MAWQQAFISLAHLSDALHDGVGESEAAAAASCKCNSANL